MSQHRVIARTGHLEADFPLLVGAAASGSGQRLVLLAHQDVCPGQRRLSLTAGQPLVNQALEDQRLFRRCGLLRRSGRLLGRGRSAQGQIDDGVLPGEDVAWSALGGLVAFGLGQNAITPHVQVARILPCPAGTQRFVRPFRSKKREDVHLDLRRGVRLRRPGRKGDRALDSLVDGRLGGQSGEDEIAGRVLARGDNDRLRINQRLEPVGGNRCPPRAGLEHHLVSAGAFAFVVLVAGSDMRQFPALFTAQRDLRPRNADAVALRRLFINLALEIADFDHGYLGRLSLGIVFALNQREVEHRVAFGQLVDESPPLVFVLVSGCGNLEDVIPRRQVKAVVTAFSGGGLSRGPAGLVLQLDLGPRHRAGDLPALLIQGKHPAVHARTGGPGRMGHARG